MKALHSTLWDFYGLGGFLMTVEKQSASLAAPFALLFLDLSLLRGGGGEALVTPVRSEGIRSLILTLLPHPKGKAFIWLFIGREQK